MKSIDDLGWSVQLVSLTGGWAANNVSFMYQDAFAPWSVVPAPPRRTSCIYERTKNLRFYGINKYSGGLRYFVPWAEINCGPNCYTIWRKNTFNPNYAHWTNLCCFTKTRTSSIKTKRRMKELKKCFNTPRFLATSSFCAIKMHKTFHFVLEIQKNIRGGDTAAFPDRVPSWEGFTPPHNPSPRGVRSFCFFFAVTRSLFGPAAERSP